MTDLTDREMLVAVCEALERRAFNEADMYVGGITWWAERLRAHLTATEPRTAPPDRPLAPCMYCCCSACGCGGG